MHWNGTAKAKSRSLAGRTQILSLSCWQLISHIVLQILQGLIRPESDETAPKFKRIFFKRNKVSGNPGFFF